MMSTVSTSQALDSACPIVLREFILADSDRKLFSGIDEFTTPDNGESLIKDKIVELHEKLLGNEHAINDQEIIDTYNLFLDSWTERRQAQVAPSLINDVDLCSWKRDTDFGVGLGFDGDVKEFSVSSDGKNLRDWTPEFDEFVTEQANDPMHIKQSWYAVLAYLMSHYDFLYE